MDKNINNSKKTTAVSEKREIKSSTQTTYPKYKGLEGWLILVIIGLFAVVGFGLFNIYGSVKLFTDGTVAFLSDVSSEFYIAGYSGALKFELVAEIILLVAASYLIYLFFRKSKKFPKMFISFLIVVVVYTILDYVLLSSLSVSNQEAKEIINEVLSEQGTETVRGIISALIWGLYMKKSKRVKATFIEE